MSLTEFIQTANGVFPQQRGSDEMFNKKNSKAYCKYCYGKSLFSAPLSVNETIIYLLLVTLSN